MQRGSKFVKYLVLWCVVISIYTSSFAPKCLARTSTSLDQRTHTQPEDEKCYAVCNFIRTLAFHRRYEQKYNWYGENTTEQNIYNAANGCGDTYAIAFYVGHGSYYPGWGPPPPGPLPEWWDWLKHYWIETDSDVWVPDMYIYPYTSDQNLRFAFLWSCYQANEIGGWNSPSNPYGMPHAWLHTTQLSADGYADPDGSNLAYIGFQEPAPFLTLYIGAEDAGYYFLLHFYVSALYNQNTINDSLDYASQKVWGIERWNESWFYGSPCYMWVYGDGSLTLL